MNTCTTCKYWSELVAQTDSEFQLTAMCLNDDSPKHHQYTREKNTCPKHEAGNSIDDPAGQWADDDDLIPQEDNKKWLHMTEILPYTVDCKGVLARARQLQWPAERYVQCFHDMPIEVAQDLLDGTLEITESGRVHFPADTEITHVDLGGA